MDMIALYQINIRQTRSISHYYLFTGVYRLTSPIHTIHQHVATKMHRFTSDLTRDELFSDYGTHVMAFCEPVSPPAFADIEHLLSTLNDPIATMDNTQRRIAFLPYSDTLSASVGHLYRVEKKAMQAFYQDFSENLSVASFIDYLRRHHYPHPKQAINAVMRGIITLDFDDEYQRVGIKHLGFHHPEDMEPHHPDYFSPPLYVDDITPLLPLFADYRSAVDKGEFKRDDRADYITQLATTFLTAAYEVPLSDKI